MANILRYKKQRIVLNRGNDTGACELLIDFKRMNNGAKYCYKDLAQSVVDDLLSVMTRHPNKIWEEQYIFVNIERDNLCDEVLIEKIAFLSAMFKLHHKTLVVEITERNQCGYASTYTLDCSTSNKMGSAWLWMIMIFMVMSVSFVVMN